MGGAGGVLTGQDELTPDHLQLVDRLWGDMIAAPLRSPAAFLNHETSVNRAALAGTARGRAAHYAADLSLTPASGERAAIAALAALDERLGTGDQRILGYLVRTAGLLLERDGAEMRLRVEVDDPGREILRWRFVSLSMPSSILLVAACVDHPPVPEKVRLLDRAMAPDGPVAHQHVHHAAMLSFEELWASLRARALADPGKLLASLASEKARCPGLHAGACPTPRNGEGQARFARRHARHMAEWAALLVDAFTIRSLIHRHARHAGGVLTCKSAECTAGRAALRRFTTAGGVALAGSSFRYPWLDERLALRRRYRSAFSAWALARSAPLDRERLVAEELARERAFMRRAFSSLKPLDSTAPDEVLELAFLQYLRVKTALFRLLVQSPGERGLKRFLEHFSQIKIYEPHSDEIPPSAPREAPLRIATTEYRVAPDAWPRHLRIAERRARRGLAAPAGQAWLIHFKRSPKDGSLPIHGRSARRIELEARQIARALEQSPARLARLRGIDICGVEEEQPLWVSAQTLQWLRGRSSLIAARRPGMQLAALHLTLHAGEDFAWLTSGTRAVAEPFFWRLIRRGDRIGHGIAVTLDPLAWWRRHHGEVIEVAPLDRLQDLGFLAAYTCPPGARSSAPSDPLKPPRTREEERWLNTEIAGVLHRLRLPFDRRGDLLGEAERFWRLIGHRDARILRLSSRALPGEPPHRAWLRTYFWSRTVQAQADTPLRLIVDRADTEEPDLLAKARAALIGELSRWQIPIECNPSSNLVVGSLDSMAAQDFLAQTDEQARRKGEETLSWTISTDDPITFATSLADEYAYAWAGMVLRAKEPYDPAHARALLEQAAAASMRTRFTPADQEFA